MKRLIKGDTPAALALGAAALILYVFTAAPSVATLFDDSLEFQVVLPTLGIAHPSGYPLLTLLGYIAIHLLPVEPYTAMLLLCRAAALLSLLFVAATTRRALLAFSFDHRTATAAAAKTADNRLSRPAASRMGMSHATSLPTSV